MKRLLLAAVLCGLFSAPVLAAHCPADVKAIDAGLSKATLGDDVKAKVMALRDEGEALHNAGNHAESMSKLAEAMRLLLENMQ